MNQQEIEALKELAGDIYENDRLADILPAAIERLEHLEKRNAILEAAVAFKGFDEVPEIGRTIQVKTRIGNISTEQYLGDKFDPRFEVGWRYPVGDLSE